MFKTIIAVLLAVILIHANVDGPRPTGLMEESAPQRTFKGDRLIPRAIEPACTQNGWPHYERRCVRGQTQPGPKPREVRIVAIDSPPSQNPVAPSAN